MTRKPRKKIKGQRRESTNTTQTFRYDELRMRHGFIDFMIQCDLPYTFLSSVYFDAFVEKYANPQFKSIPKEVTRDDIMERFQDQREQVKELVEGIRGKFSLSFETWVSETPNDHYLCLTEYFIDDEWKLNKRIISLSRET